VKDHILAVDIARKRDYFNIQVGKLTPEIIPGSTVMGTEDRLIHYLDIIHIEKYQNITYDEAVDHVERLAKHRDLVGNHDLIVDGTGVGDAAVELIRKRNLTPVPIVFTSGGSVREVRGDSTRVFRLTPASSSVQTMAILEQIDVPKADLVVAGTLLLQQRRVRVAPGLRWKDDFLKQMMGFRGKVNEKTNRVKFEADTEALHDDQVVCYLMMAWWYQRLTRQVRAPEGPLVRAEERLADTRPYMED
jgi:hypothetical protein